MNVFAVTGIGLAVVVLSIYLGVAFPITLGFGVWNIPIWAFVAAVILYAAAVLPTPMFVQPTNYLAFYPAYAAIPSILFGALLTPSWGASFLGLTLPRARAPTSIQLPAGSHSSYHHVRCG